MTTTTLVVERIHSSKEHIFTDPLAWVIIGLIFTLAITNNRKED